MHLVGLYTYCKMVHGAYYVKFHYALMSITENVLLTQTFVFVHEVFTHSCQLPLGLPEKKIILLLFGVIL